MTTAATTAAGEVAARVPRVLWAQRNDVLYLTVEVVEAADEVVTWGAQSLDVTASQAGVPYKVHLDFYGAIVPEESTTKKSERNLFFVIKKAGEDVASAPYWPRLLAPSAGKPHFLHTDFGRWKDEDDEDDEAAEGLGAGGMPDFSQMLGGGGGMPGFGQMMGGAGGEGDDAVDYSQFANMAGISGFPNMGGEGGEGDEEEEEEDESDPYQTSKKVDAPSSDDE